MIVKDEYGFCKDYLFGRAYPAQYLAFVTTFRLYDDDHEVHVARCAKIIIHEFGHLLGLGTARARLSDGSHCADPLCVMRFTPDVFDLDDVSDRLCENCTHFLRALIGLASQIAQTRTSVRE